MQIVRFLTITCILFFIFFKIRIDVLYIYMHICVYVCIISDSVKWSCFSTAYQ